MRLAITLRDKEQFRRGKHLGEINRILKAVAGPKKKELASRAACGYRQEHLDSHLPLV